MDLIDSKSDSELLESTLVEIAKSKNEIACAKRDIQKVENRLNFCIVLANKLIDRKGD
jgi:hypothetical protein